MISLDDLKASYLLKEHTLDFAKGKRSILRYALESKSAYYTRVNPHGPQPFEYLSYAKNDVSSGKAQGAINGLGNAKRAIHLTIDALFRVWGLKTAYRRANFPTKLAVMQILDAFPIRSLETLNQKRNLIEHDYETISNKEAADFIDIAEMFLMLAHPYLRNAVISAFVGVEQDERCLEWSLDISSSQINTYEILSQKFTETSIGRVYYDILADEQEKRLIQTLKIAQSNQAKWITYLDLFVYLSKRKAHFLPESDERGDGIFIETHRINFM